jgi:hypothetical protein
MEKLSRAHISAGVLVVTDVVATEKPAFIAPAATVTVAGTVAAE